jgi:hypothetical protein
MKTCFKCRATKPLNQFYGHSKMADGHLNKCIECTRKDTATRVARLSQDPAWAVAERARHRAKSAQARANGRARVYTREETRISLERWTNNHPHKRAAHQAVSNAIRCGKLVKQPCEKCGALKVQAHHDDYSKPLDVRWLCIPHHNQHHVREREQELINQLRTSNV